MTTGLKFCSVERWIILTSKYFHIDIYMYIYRLFNVLCILTKDWIEDLVLFIHKFLRQHGHSGNILHSKQLKLLLGSLYLNIARESDSKEILYFTKHSSCGVSNYSIYKVDIMHYGFYGFERELFTCEIRPGWPDMLVSERISCLFFFFF